MRIKEWVIALMIFFLSPQLTLAVSSMDNKTISQAQEYGIKSISKSTGEFLYPWLSFEEQAETIDESTERAHFYTPFLLVADDARRKSLAKQRVDLAAGEAIVTDYAGYFVFSVVLKGDEPNFASGLKVTLRQDKLAINAQVSASPVQKYEDAQKTKTYYMANFHFYFKNEKLSLTKPIFLLVALKNKQERRFYFDLAKIK